MPSPVSRESRLNSHIGHIIVIQKITIKTRQEQLLTDAERYSIQFDSTHKRARSRYCHITFLLIRRCPSWCCSAAARRGIAETRVLARDEWQESATIPAPGSYKDAHRRSYGIATAPCTVLRPAPAPNRRAPPRGLRAGRDGVSLPRRLSRGSACVARRAAGAGPLFRVTAPTR